MANDLFLLFVFNISVAWFTAELLDPVAASSGCMLEGSDGSGTAADTAVLRLTGFELLDGLLLHR